MYRSVIKKKRNIAVDRLAISLIFLFGAVLFFPSNAKAAGDYCFYFKDGGIGEQCAEFDSASVGPVADTTDYCKFYNVELENPIPTGKEIFPLNLMGAAELPSNIGKCPTLSIFGKPGTPEIPLTALKIGHGVQKIVFPEGTGELEVLTDVMANIAGKLGQKNGFVFSASVQVDSNVKTAKTEFSDLLTDYLNKNASEFCCIARHGVKPEQYYNCTVPKLNTEKTEEIAETFYKSITEAGKQFDAKDVFENSFVKSLLKPDGTLDKKMLYDSAGGYTVYRCYGTELNNLADYHFYPVSCTSESIFITPVDQKNETVPMSATPASFCAMKPEPSTKRSEDTYSGVPLNLDEIQAMGLKLKKSSANSAQQLLGIIIKTLMGILGSIALAMFVYGGFMVMAGGGNSEKTAKGTQILIWSALGVIIILSSYIAVQFVFEILAS